MAIVGAKIKKKRESRGLSRRELSERSGVSMNTIRKWEESEIMYRCDLVSLMKVVVELDCSLQDFVEDGQILRIKNKKITK